ncbi:MAG: nitrite reductase small subunit NirD [Gammaproteobacteria bacterium]|jgi:nitrite reductase (NADH) small subunit
MLTEAVENSGWLQVGTLEDIPRLGARIVKTTSGDIAVFRNASDEVFALLDKCPHKGGPLSQGIVHDKSVTCPLHNWVIGLSDGLAKAPDEGCAKSFPVKLQDGTIYLLIE